MEKVSVIIPSRNEVFLQHTIDDILSKAKGEIEVIAVLDGYWPSPPLKPDDRLIILHRGKPMGLRNAVNAASEIATGKYLMKCDAHCMFGEGFDIIMAADCEKDWISVPRRYSLDAENWCRKKKMPVDYLYIEDIYRGAGCLEGKVWDAMNRNKELKNKEIDDLLTFQGSCWFMHKEYFFWMDKFDEENYGTFRKEPQEISFKCWLSGGRVIRNKKTWYAHLHKGKKYGRMYHASRSDWRKGDEYNKKWLTNEAWDSPKRTKDFRWLIEKFNPPGWENFDWENFKW